MAREQLPQRSHHSCGVSQAGTCLPDKPSSLSAIPEYERRSEQNTIADGLTEDLITTSVRHCWFFRDRPQFHASPTKGDLWTSATSAELAWPMFSRAALARLALACASRRS